MRAQGKKIELNKNLKNISRSPWKTMFYLVFVLAAVVVQASTGAQGRTNDPGAIPITYTRPSDRAVARTQPSKPAGDRPEAPFLQSAAEGLSNLRWATGHFPLTTKKTNWLT